MVEIGGDFLGNFWDRGIGVNWWGLFGDVLWEKHWWITATNAEH